MPPDRHRRGWLSHPPILAATRQAVEGADLVILAVPCPALAGIATDLSNALPGTVVVDPGALVVKAFNTVLASRHADPAVAGVPLDAFIAGEAATAKGKGGELVVAREPSANAAFLQLPRKPSSMPAPSPASPVTARQERLRRRPDGNEFEVMWMPPGADWGAYETRRRLKGSTCRPNSAAGPACAATGRIVTDTTSGHACRPGLASVPAATPAASQPGSAGP